MKKIANNYYDVYNFLNIINRRLGKLFKLTRYSPLPDGFVVTEENLTELLTIDQIKDETVMPFFVGQEKKNIKKLFKNGLKNCKYVIKHQPFLKYCSKEFELRIRVYFNIRKDMFDIILKDFNSQDADEVQFYRECYNINPILGRAMDVLYENHVDFDKLFDGLEEKYNLAYQERIKSINKKTQKTIEKAKETTAQIQLQQNKQKSNNLQKERKNIEKIAKNEQKTAKKREIQAIKNVEAKKKPSQQKRENKE